MKHATVENTELFTLLRRVKIFAGKDRGLPLLNTVHLVERGGNLYAEATDRYRLLIRKCGGEVQVDEGLDLLVSIENLDKLLSVLRTTKHGHAFIDREDDNIRIRTNGIEFDFKQHGTESYPPIERLLPDLSKLDDSGWTFVDPKKIKDLSPVGEKHATLLLATVRSGGKPDGNPQLVFSTDPEVEIGMLMGIRTTEHDNPLNKLRSNWNWLPKHH